MNQSQESLDIKMNKNEARNTVKSLRKAFPEETAAGQSDAICKKAVALPEYINASVVYIYKSIRNETCTDYIIRHALENQKTVALPKVMGDDLFFYKITSLCDLSLGYQGIPEPLPDAQKIIDTDEGIIFVPGVAFDNKCNRCGYGKGFYDRFLSKHPRLYKTGLAFSFQIFEDLEFNSNDIPLDSVITEKNIFKKN